MIYFTLNGVFPLPFPVESVAEAGERHIRLKTLNLQVPAKRIRSIDFAARGHTVNAESLLVDVRVIFGKRKNVVLRLRRVDNTVSVQNPVRLARIKVRIFADGLAFESPRGEFGRSFARFFCRTGIYLFRSLHDGIEYGGNRVVEIFFRAVVKPHIAVFEKDLPPRISRIIRLFKVSVGLGQRNLCKKLVFKARYYENRAVSVGVGYEIIAGQTRFLIFIGLSTRGKRAGNQHA